MGNKKETTVSSFSTLQKVKKVVHYLSAILMYSICLIMILIFIAFIVNFIDQKNNLSKGIQKPSLFSAYTIVSPSMVPKIDVLDVVVTKRVNSPKDISVNDIITFNSTDYRYSGVTITHRVVKIEKTDSGEYLFTTRGDANNTNDSSRLTFNDIYGKVILRVPKIGYIQYFLSSITGWIIIIIIPTVIILGLNIRKILLTIKKDAKVQLNKDYKKKNEQKKANQKDKKIKEEKKKNLKDREEGRFRF